MCESKAMLCDRDRVATPDPASDGSTVTLVSSAELGQLPLMMPGFISFHFYLYYKYFECYVLGGKMLIDTQLDYPVKCLIFQCNPIESYSRGNSA